MNNGVSAHRQLALLLLALFVFTSTACVSVPGGPEPNDPWEPFNRSMYDFNDGIDKDIIEPVADAYLKIPDGGRKAIHNFFANLTYPTTVINQFLQGKFERGFEDSMRFIFNTTFGLLGFIDIAGPSGLARHDEDFGQTFAVWGIPSGNFVTLPVLGPKTVRSALGWPLDFLTTPLFWIETGAEFIAVAGLDIVDSRARLAPAIRLRDGNRIRSLHIHPRGVSSAAFEPHLRRQSTDPGSGGSGFAGRGAVARGRKGQGKHSIDARM